MFWQSPNKKKTLIEGKQKLKSRIRKNIIQKHALLQVTKAIIPRVETFSRIGQLFATEGILSLCGFNIMIIKCYFLMRMNHTYA